MKIISKINNLKNIYLVLIAGIILYFPDASNAQAPTEINNMVGCKCSTSHIDISLCGVPIGSSSLTINTLLKIKARKNPVEISVTHSEEIASSDYMMDNSNVSFFYGYHGDTDCNSNDNAVYIEVSPVNKFRKYGQAIKNSSIHALTNNGIKLGISEVYFLKNCIDIVFSEVYRTKGFTVYLYSCNEKIYEFPDSTPVVLDTRPFQSEVFTNYAFYRMRQRRYSRNYIARYIFKDGVLIKFGFGYLYKHPTTEFENVLY